jgi:hypothetical protein
MKLKPFFLKKNHNLLKFLIKNRKVINDISPDRDTEDDEWWSTTTKYLHIYLYELRFIFICILSPYTKIDRSQSENRSITGFVIVDSSKILFNAYN